jgi:hypothetical protein
VPEIKKSSKTTEQRVAAMFAINTAEHELTVLHDDGVYRHIRMAKPGTVLYRYDLTTWPGYLAISGDLDSYVFSRVDDMFSFFRNQQVNPMYWGGKVQDGRERIKSYSEDHFKQLIKERLTGLRAADLTKEQRETRKEILAQVNAGDGYNEADARDILAQGERADLLADTWEWSLSDWDFHFLYCLNAIVGGIKAYDSAIAAASRPGGAA